jgi:hypothetical protein
MPLLTFIHDQKNAETIAFAATLLCLWIAAHSAQRVHKERSRTFTALALLALNWGILLLYYLPGPPQNEILSAFSGFVLVYIGALLHREAIARDRPRDGDPPLVWLDTVPLLLLRATVMGYGVYLIAQRLFHIEYGISTLALSLWGTLLTTFGYAALWIGLVYLHQHRPDLHRLSAWLGLFFLVYALVEVGYSVWYGREYWPAYGRYLTLQSRQGAPDFETPLPFYPQPDWPHAVAWARLADHSEALKLKVEPNVPEPWLWLTYALSALKLALTGVVLVLVMKPPSDRGNGERPTMIQWLDRRLRLTPAEEGKPGITDA